MTPQTIAVLDFGSQYSQLIARRIRDHHVFSLLMAPSVSPQELRQHNLAGIVLSGGPNSVYEPGAPRMDPAILELGVPVLGICYGMQLGCQLLGGDVRAGRSREYGRTRLQIAENLSPLLRGLPDSTTVWMSHGDVVDRLGESFISLAQTDCCPFAAVRHRDRAFFGVQFHPEVTHTPQGEQIFKNFLYDICKCTGDWLVGSFVDDALARIRDQVGSHRVICGLSGGVDSSVAAALIHRAIGDQLTCIFVDNGLLRAGEATSVEQTFRGHFNIDLRVVDAAERFLSKLAGVTDPQQKRVIIGHEFIDVFKSEADRIKAETASHPAGPGGEVKFLAQGTLYPDVIESGKSVGGHAANIKLHHNVGGLPEQLGFELVEPLRDLFKDEVRRVGEYLGLPEELVWRHPFPGPGLAVRIIGDITPDRLSVLRLADQIVIDELRAAGLYRSSAQTFAVLLPVRSVGVMGDGRSYDAVCCIRSVDSSDFMTADWSRIPYDVLATMSNRIINEVRGINRVVYDISSKPPSTIEWE